MIKVDLHIHTKSIAPWDSEFVFSMDKLHNYVYENQLSCIAITNHNRFDKEQYEDICEKLEGIAVFPGIEINVLNGHVIVVGSKDDVGEIEDISNTLSVRLNKLEDYLSLEEFAEIIKHKKYMVIPHYGKAKSLSLTSIKKLDPGICIGEVGSPKKFLSMINDDDEVLTPVIFSDLRCAEQTNEQKSQETRYTYVKVDTASYNLIFEALKSKQNVGVSPFEDDTFDLLNGVVRGHMGINVILGNRSTGKSFLLDNIHDSFCRENNVLYIKQFELAKNSESNAFRSNIDNANELEIRKYCSDINTILLELKGKNYNSKKYDVDEYLRTLNDYAERNSLENAFSKMKLFNYDRLYSHETNYDYEIAMAIAKLLDSDKERLSIIEEKVKGAELTELLRIFIDRAKSLDYINRITEESNMIAKAISDQLARKSPLKPVASINFCEIYEKGYTRQKLDGLLLNIKNQEIMDKKVSDKFHRKITLFKPSYNNKDRYKEETGQKRIDELKNLNSVFDVFVNHIDDHFATVDDDELYSFFIGKTSSVTTLGDKELSGGEKAEYILIDKLQNYEKYDIVLIDEMESSFDNAYLNEFINKLLHEISEKCTVFISTHNNNLGVSLNPDYYIYHEYIYDDNSSEEFLRYYGSSTAMQLQASDGTMKNLNAILLGAMEASAEAYDERKAKYEVPKN